MAAVIAALARNSGKINIHTPSPFFIKNVALTALQLGLFTLTLP
jgi:hypothetical protein